MTKEAGSVELYRKYRPTRLKDVVGQEVAVRGLEQMLDDGKLPHVILLAGPSGTGKTSIGRILQKELECSDIDFSEYNCADSRGIDVMREIRQSVSGHPMMGKTRIWLLDEFHRATSDGASLLLKVLEDTPKHAYFFLCTTDPQKLLATIKSRCHEIKLQPIPEKAMSGLLTSVAEKERFKLSPAVRDRIIEVAEGGARKALVLLHGAMGFKTEAEQLSTILKNDTKRQTIDLCRALINGESWPKVAEMIQQLEDEPETIRRAVLGYANAVILKGGKTGKAFLVLQAFRDHWYDTGKVGMTIACYDVTSQK